MSVGLTRSRFINALRCYASYALNRLGSALFRTPYTIHHTPLFVSVEPSAVCQLHCPACPVGLRNNEITELRHSDRLLKKDLWERILSQIKDSAWVVQFYFQGEPLLNKDLPLMIREAHDAGLYTIVSTNAQAMTPELAKALVAAGLDRIIISMDGLTQETYEAYRVGGSLDQCKAALRWLREAKKTLTIELQVLRLKSNEHEWRAFRKEYKALGADRLVFKTAQLYDYRHGHPLMPSEPRYRRYEQHADGLWYRKPLGKGCFRVWSGVVIAANGDVLPCCYDKDHAHAYGNLRTASLRELFSGPAARTFRAQALLQTPQICQECWK
ncbi:MAG: SPASM domain-containing protein [Lachnospiraceae bacterium]|nr:SPASM domain-containing protein [Lachnospiraceae bacterium]